MKNKILLSALFLSSFALNSQSSEHRWNVGVHGGFMQYNGDLGNGFYRFEKAFYGNVGLSVNRYLTPHWDATILATRGVLGYLGQWNADPTVPTRFLTNITTINLLGKYNFLHPESWFRPYLCAGAGMLLHNGVGESFIARRKYDFALPEVGAGLNFHFGKFITLQLQELLMLTNADDIDFNDRGRNDMYLLHSAGVTFNIGKLGKLGGPEQTGVGDKIDKCPKVKQHRNKVTKSEGQALRKERKSARKSKRKKG